MPSDRSAADLNWRQRLFFRWWCYPPPGNWARDSRSPDMTSDPLWDLHRVFGAEFEKAINGRVVLDVGCGAGWQVVGCAEAGARRAVGIDTRPLFGDGLSKSDKVALAKKVQFTTQPLRDLDAEWADVAYSVNAFEHIDQPEQVLADICRALKPGGQFFVTFSPPWWHPYGAHLKWMCRYPWPQVLWSEETVLAVRRLYRSDNATRYEDCAGGLNRMTIAKFRRLITGSGLDIMSLRLTPIRPVPRVVATIPVVNECLTSNVSAIAVKPRTHRDVPQSVDGVAGALP